MSGYIDIHSHILPVIDDGPAIMAESIALAEAYVAGGYRAVIATPHASEGEPPPALILERLQELQQELDQRKILLKLLPGAEQHIEPHTLERLQEGQLLTLNQSRFFLLELPFFQPLPPYTKELIFNLTTSGYTPIIPHPERTRDLQNNLQLIYELHQAGALFQVTWGALTGLLGPDARDLVIAMYRANLVHFFATDAHHAESRLLAVDKAVRILEEVEEGEEAGKLAQSYLYERPYRMLKNRALDLPPASEPEALPKKSRSLLSRLRRTTDY